MNREAFNKWIQALEAPENQSRQITGAYSGYITNGDSPMGRVVRRDYSRCCSIGLAMSVLLSGQDDSTQLLVTSDDLTGPLGIDGPAWNDLLSGLILLNDVHRLPFDEIAQHLRTWVAKQDAKATEQPLGST